LLFSGLAIGNFDGDAFADLVVGAPRTDRGTIVDNGAIHVFPGDRRGPSTARDFERIPTLGGSALYGATVGAD